MTDDIVLTAVDNTSYGPTGLPIISSAVTIEGNGHTIERDSVATEFRILAVNSTGDLTLNETTVSGGVAAPGGPLFFREGGGIFNRHGAVSMTASTVSNNSADFGGGVLNDDNGNLSIKDSMISGHSGCEGVVLTTAGQRMSLTEQQLTSFAGLVLIQQLFTHLELKQRLRDCFRHLTASPIFGWPSMMLLLIVHTLLGYRDLRHIRVVSHLL